MNRNRVKGEAERKERHRKTVDSFVHWERRAEISVLFSLSGFRIKVERIEEEKDVNKERGRKM